MDSGRAFLLAVIGTLLLASVLLALPYVQYVLLAVVLAFALYPVQRRLAERIERRKAAALLTFVTTVAVIVPLAGFTWVVATRAATVVRQLRAGDITADVIEDPVENATGIEIQLDALFQSMTDNGSLGGFDSLLDVFGLATHAVLGFGLTLFLVYYFLKDGDRFARWLSGALPMEADAQRALYREINQITWAVLAGHVLVAVIQGGIAGIGLFAVGIPSALFWTIVMIVLSLLPIVGSFLVWGPAAAFLLVNGQPVAAAGLAVYGTIVVGVTDDYLRPIVVDRYAAVNPSVIIVGVLGGLSVIGFMGIFVGPVIIGALRATVDVYREEYRTAE